MDVELEKGAKTMHTYLIYIIQNLQDGENTGSYKKTHLPANVPWNQEIRMRKNDLHILLNINCHLTITRFQSEIWHIKEDVF